MQTKLLLSAGLATGLAMQLCLSAMANGVTITTVSSGTLNEVIPDNSSNGVASTITMNNSWSDTVNVQVTLKLAGSPTAYNGDYYAYLQFGSGLDVLLNFIDNGTGDNAGDGMNITLSDSASVNVQAAPAIPEATLTGTYQPANSLTNTFDGMDPNGQWTLFIADESAGDVGQLQSWSLSVTALPDNSSTWLMLALGLGALKLMSLRKFSPARIFRR